MLEEHGVVRDYETELVCKQGGAIPVSITLARLTDAHGNSIGTVGIGRDISQRKALLNQIVQSERLAAVGRLAAGVAHEINNPLATIDSIAGYLEDLGEEQSPSLLSELPTGLAKIQAQVRRCHAITSHLLGFSRQGDARVEAAEVNQAILEVLPFLEKEARLAGIKIHQSLELELPTAKINTGQLEEILINLITNAIHALRDLEERQIWVSSRLAPERRIVIRVRDDGPGIQDEVRNRIFDPFVSTKPLGEGTGLGLSICYGIVKRCGGEIRVESTLGGGATFDLVLPTLDSTGESRVKGHSTRETAQ
jgi:two-component system NtrC family sensor kinase